MKPNTRDCQEGVALIFALLLLLVMTILGVTAMSNVVMQERMAGNVNLQALAFESASAGITEALEYGLEKSNWPETDLNGNPVTSCDRGDGWRGDWTAWEIFATYGQVTARFRKRVDCYEDQEFADEDGFSSEDVPAQLFVLSEGQVIDNSGSPLSIREIEVRVENRGGDPDCIVNAGPLCSANMATSKFFTVDAGEGGCPIRTWSNDDTDMIKQELRDGQNNSRVGQYRPPVPGIHHSETPKPWGDPYLLARTMNAVKLGMQAHDEWLSWNAGTQPEDASPFFVCKGTLRTGTTKLGGPGGPCGSGTSVPEISGLTYIAGDFAMGGNQFGSGTLIIEGEVCWNGTANFEGDIVALGGLFEMKGGGGNEDKATTSGSLYLNNLHENVNAQDTIPAYSIENPDPEFQCSDLDFSGGGKHEFNDACDERTDRWDQVNECIQKVQEYGSDLKNAEGEARDALLEPFDDSPNLLERFEEYVDGDEDLQIPAPRCGDGVGLRRAIASWRENIGWRDQ